MRTAALYTETALLGLSEHALDEKGRKHIQEGIHARLGQVCDVCDTSQERK
jgi:hypothetical protein